MTDTAGLREALIAELHALTPITVPLKQGGSQPVGWALPDWLMHRLVTVLATADTAVAGEATCIEHSDWCVCAEPDHEACCGRRRAASAGEPCSVEPALSQHEYAVAYCETHDQPADQCAPQQPVGIDALGKVRERLVAIYSTVAYNQSAEADKAREVILIAEKLLDRLTEQEDSR